MDLGVKGFCIRLVEHLLPSVLSSCLSILSHFLIMS